MKRSLSNLKSGIFIIIGIVSEVHCSRWSAGQCGQCVTVLSGVIIFSLLLHQPNNSSGTMTFSLTDLFLTFLSSSAIKINCNFRCGSISTFRTRLLFISQLLIDRLFLMSYILHSYIYNVYCVLQWTAIGSFFVFVLKSNYSIGKMVIPSLFSPLVSLLLRLMITDWSSSNLIKFVKCVPQLPRHYLVLPVKQTGRRVPLNAVSVNSMRQGGLGHSLICLRIKRHPHRTSKTWFGTIKIDPNFDDVHFVAKNTEQILARFTLNFKLLNFMTREIQLTDKKLQESLWTQNV